MQTFISPLGYDSTRVTRPVLRHGIESGDRIVMLRPTTAGENDQHRAEEAVTDVTQMLSQVDPSIAVTVESITHDDFELAVRECLDVLDAAQGDVVVNFGGGPRELFLSFTLATLTAADRITTAYQFCDMNGSVRELTIPPLLTPIPEPAWATLELVAAADDATTIPDVTDRSERSKSTVTRHVNQLADRGLVTTWMEGKIKRVRLTLAGELRLRAN